MRGGCGFGRVEGFGGLLFVVNEEGSCSPFIV